MHSEVLVNRFLSFELKLVHDTVRGKSLRKEIFESKSKCLLQLCTHWSTVSFLNQ